MPLYVADYRADTAHLNAAQHGAYLLLIMHYWQTGSLPKDDAAMARIACMSPSEWRKTCPVIFAFFDGNWSHKRIDAERSRAAEISSKRSASAKQKKNNGPANAEQLDTHAGATSQPQSPKKESTPDGVPKYVFEDGVIRLNQRDFEGWKQAYSYLDLAAELLSLSKWASEQGEKWFHAVKGALAKRNRDVKAEKERLASQGGFKWNGGREGVI